MVGCAERKRSTYKLIWESTVLDLTDPYAPATRPNASVSIHFAMGIYSDLPRVVAKACLIRDDLHTRRVDERRQIPIWTFNHTEAEPEKIPANVSPKALAIGNSRRGFSPRVSISVHVCTINTLEGPGSRSLDTVWGR